MMTPASIDRERLLTALSDLFPWSRAYINRPIGDYAATLYDNSDDLGSKTRLHARRLLCKWVRQKALHSGFNALRANRLAKEMDAFPVLQTGPHLHLLIEPDAFFTHLFSLIGLSARDSRCYVSYACSTVKFAERSRKGPGWLRLDDQPINVFGLSRREMIPYSVLACNRPYEFVLRPADPASAPTAAIRDLRTHLPDGAFPSAAAAIKVANRQLWDRYFDRRVDFLQLDDDDVVDLVLMHLEEPTSWLRTTFLRDVALPVTILRAVDRLASTAWRNWLRNSTHFFWGCDNGRIFPMVLDGGHLRPSDGVGPEISFTADGLSKALLARQIIPNLFLVFMVIAILPAIRVLGGSRHTVYYPLMRYAFCSALVDSGRDDALLRSIIHDRRPGAWGHRVISDKVEPFALLRSREGALPGLLARYRAMTLSQACGSLESFTDDPLWVDLALALANGTASTKGGPWSFA